MGCTHMGRNWDPGRNDPPGKGVEDGEGWECASCGPLWELVGLSWDGIALGKPGRNCFQKIVFGRGCFGASACRMLELIEKSSH